MSEVNNTEKGRQTIELLYWIWYCIDKSTGRAIDFPSDLWEANRQFFKNWGSEFGEILPQHLHPAIPSILHELMASGIVADYPEYMPKTPVAGRFEQMESRNSGRISLYPPFNFQIYITTYGWAHLEFAIQKGELGKALSQNGRVIDWEQIAPTGKGGRPRYMENDWARQQVNELGRTPGDVYPEWLEMSGARAKLLDDPYDSFSKAIRTKKRK